MPKTQYDLYIEISTSNRMTISEWKKVLLYSQDEIDFINEHNKTLQYALLGRLQKELYIIQNKCDFYVTMGGNTNINDMKSLQLLINKLSNKFSTHGLDNSTCVHENDEVNHTIYSGDRGTK